VLQCGGSVVQCVVVCWKRKQCIFRDIEHHTQVCVRVAVNRSVLQCVAVCCTMLHCVASASSTYLVILSTICKCVCVRLGMRACVRMSVSVDVIVSGRVHVCVSMYG